MIIKAEKCGWEKEALGTEGHGESQGPWGLGARFGGQVLWEVSGKGGGSQSFQVVFKLGWGCLILIVMTVEGR